MQEGLQCQGAAGLKCQAGAERDKVGTGRVLADTGHNPTEPERGEQSWPGTVARVRHTSVTAAQVHIDAAGLGSSQEVKSEGQDQDQ